MSDVAAQINDFLTKKDSPMAGLGNVIVAAGKKYGVDPKLIVGISGAESSFGQHLFGDHNAWGWGPGKNFSSWEEGISSVAKGLRTGYLNAGLTTPAAISRKWAPAGAANDPGGLNANWTKNVSGFMQELGASPSGASSSRVANATASALGTPKAVPAFDPTPIIAAGGGFSPEFNVRRLVDSMVAFDNRPVPKSGPAVPTAGTPLQPPLTHNDGSVRVASGANRAGMALHPQVVDFVRQIAGTYGKPLTIGTGTNHNQYVIGTTRQSAHWTGWAADIPMSGKQLTNLGRAALVTAGMPRAKAAQQNGGLFNIGPYQIIFNSMIGGNHYNHLHVGLSGSHAG